MIPMCYNDKLWADEGWPTQLYQNSGHLPGSWCWWRHGEQDIAEQCTFTANDAVNKSAIAAFETSFLRKGVVDAFWKNHLTAEQSARIDAVVAEKTADTGLVYDYGQ